jgi:hypothetical protein
MVGMAHAVPSKGFECSICQRMFSRKSRAQACEDNHRGVKEYRCRGGCGDTNWWVVLLDWMRGRRALADGLTLNAPFQKRTNHVAPCGSGHTARGSMDPQLLCQDIAYHMTRNTSHVNTGKLRTLSQTWTRLAETIVVECSSRGKTLPDIVNPAQKLNSNWHVYDNSRRNLSNMK